jgi:hypothetical protein
MLHRRVVAAKVLMDVMNAVVVGLDARAVARKVSHAVSVVRSASSAAHATRRIFLPA